MTLNTLLLIGAVAAIMVFFAAYLFFQPSDAISRLEAALRLGDAPLEEVAKPEKESNLGEDLREQFQSAIGKRVESLDQGAKLRERLARADVPLHPAEWMMVSIAIGIGLGLLLMARFGSIFFILIGIAVGYLGCEQYIRFKARKRAKAFDAQLSPTLLSIGGALKAGYTFAQAIDLVSKHSPQPMQAELSRVVREYQLGVPLEQALARMAGRTGSEDFALVHTAVRIQAQTGGNLAQIIDRIEFTIRERVRIKGEIKTLTGQARASGWILTILPFAMGGLMSFIAPSYFDPMFGTLPGRIMLGACLLMLGLGTAIVRKIVDIKV